MRPIGELDPAATRHSVAHMSIGEPPRVAAREASGTKPLPIPPNWLGFLLAAVLLHVWIPSGAGQERESSSPRNLILIGWDGTQREHLLDLLRSGKMPNLKALIDQGCLVPTQVTTGPTQTKSGWAEILTGQNALSLGILSNRDYQPIPKGLTVFERLKAHFGPEKLATIFIGGKSYNIGSRGPHEVCENCLGRDSVTHRSSFYWEKDRFKVANEPLTTRDGKPPRWVPRAGEPFLHAREALDEYEVGLGPAENVGPRALHLLNKYRDRRFLAFIHFEEPDEPGHLHGENSPAYGQALMTVDGWLGRIVSRLKELGLHDRTTVFVTTDHGMDEGGFEHAQAPDTFLATNHKGPLRTGDRKDIAPTILDYFGVNTATIRPPLEGLSLVAHAHTAGAPGTAGLPGAAQKSNPPVRLGYFHGGRSVMIYRTHVFGFFAQENAEVELHTKWLDEDKLFQIPPDFGQAEAMRSGRRFFGKIDGMEIIQKMLAGELDGGTVGESSFLSYASKGAPIVAVAMLGHDVAGQGGKGIVFRNGVVIRSPEDLKNKTLVSRRAGPGDAIFLREFLESVGMASEKSITILDQLDEEEVERLLEEGKVDGGLYHLRTMRRLIEKKRAAYVYRTMDWMNPELSHSLLVFRKDFVSDRPDAVEKIVRAYVKRIQFERELPEEARRKPQDKSLMMDLTFEGMTIPDYDLPPLVRLDLLREMHRLLVKYKFSATDPHLPDFIDNRFVEKAYQKKPVAISP